jgi:hypothetical protein
MSLGSHRALLAAAGVGGFDDEGSWHAINSTLLASNTASVSLTSAGSEKPWSDYQDLVLIMVARGTNNGTPGVTTTFNSGASGGYQWEELHGNGTSVSAAGTRDASYFRVGHLIGADHNADYFCTSVTQFVNISAAGPFKMAVTQEGFMSEESSGDNSVMYRCVNWDNTAAITEFTMNPDGNFLAGSRFDLYGIKGG